MAPLNQREYDWEIGGYGFRLAGKDLTQQQPHMAEPIEFLAQQISSTAEATYTDINRKGEFAFAQAKFGGGLAKKQEFGLDTQTQYRYSKGVDTSWPFPLPTSKINTVGSSVSMNAAPSLAVQRGNITYFAAGTQLYQIATSSSTPTLDSTFAVAITALFLWQGNLIVGQGSANVYCYRTNDTASSPTSGSTAFTNASTNGHFFATTGDLLYKAISPKTVSIADAINGPWADYDVGDNQYAITSLAVEDQVIIVGKEDGPYVFDLDFVAQPLVPELRIQADAAVCRAAQTFNRDYFASTRLGAVRIRPSEGLKMVGFDTLADPALPGGVSTINRMTTDGRFLYALVATTGTAGVFIWKQDFDGNWHNFQYRTDLGVLGDSPTLLQAVSKIGSTSVNAILFCYRSGANYQLAYARFPATLDPTKDPAFDFETAVTCYLRTLDYSAAYPTVPKFADRIKSVVDNSGSTRKSTYAAWLDDEAASRALAEFVKSPFDEVQIKSLPQFHRVSLEIGLTSDATSAPRLRAFHMSADLLPRVVRLHKVQFIAESGIALATGGFARDDWQVIVDNLRTLRAGRKTVECRDEDLREFSGYIEDITEWSASDKVSNEPVKIITATIKEVAAVA